MNLSDRQSPLARSDSRGSNLEPPSHERQHPDYLCMTPPGGEDQISVIASFGPDKPKPFDNLIQHKHYISKKPPAPCRSASQEGKSEATAKEASNRGLFSRLIRRNSSKERKMSSSKTPEDLSASIEPLHEVPTDSNLGPGCQGNDPFGICQAAEPGAGLVRRGSVDVLDTRTKSPMKITQRSASFSQRGWGTSNLTDEQKHMSSKLLSELSATLPRFSSSKSIGAQSSSGAGIDAENVYLMVIPTSVGRTSCSNDALDDAKYLVSPSPPPCLSRGSSCNTPPYSRTPPPSLNRTPPPTLSRKPRRQSSLPIHSQV